MSSTVSTFVDACLRGVASLSDIDDWVDRWHETDFQGEAPSLFEYLGFTPDEGKLWVENPAALSAIVDAHRDRHGERVSRFAPPTLQTLGDRILDPQSIESATSGYRGIVEWEASLVGVR